ncbi:MAG: hypothetical protein GWM93_09310, partial [Gemmatimonadetes bacterium]|nr:hypothetical protein [Gemmatimonadota bacterium]NIT66860.1 hypothetical protein [Gemmatimonadota bacterium]NIY35437.1 hypothetical protein [Gemmatimonadota bacterium]
AENALEALDGARLAGRALRLSWARERDERPGTRQSGTARGSTSRDAGDGQDEESGPDRDEARSERDSRDEDDDYAGKRRTKPRTRRHGGHGSDRKRGRGTRRFLD